jgi:hypothetical protein
MAFDNQATQKGRAIDYFAGVVKNLDKKIEELRPAYDYWADRVNKGQAVGADKETNKWHSEWLECKKEMENILKEIESAEDSKSGYQKSLDDLILKKP